MKLGIKSSFARAFAGGFGKQLLCAIFIFVVVLLLAIGIRFCCVKESNDVINKVLVEMLSPVPYANDVFHSGNAAANDVTLPSEGYRTHGGLFWVYLLGSIVISGLIIAIITNFLRGVGERYKSGEIRYRLSGHTVVLGYNNITLGLLKHILAQTGSRFILLQVTNNVSAVYQQLSVSLSKKQMKRVLLVHADRTSKHQLQTKLRVHMADKIYILGDNDEANHDAKNLGVVDTIAQICAQNGTKEVIPCSVAFNNRSTFQLFQVNDWDKNVTEHLRVYPFSFYTNWAHKVWVRNDECFEGKPYPSLDFEGIKKDDNSTVHLFIVGMTSMGRTMAAEAAHLTHFPNFVRDSKLKTKITFIDENAIRESQYFMNRNSPLFALSHWRKYVIDHGKLQIVEENVPKPEDDFLDIEWEFIEGDVSEKCLREMISDCAVDTQQFVTIICCLPEVQMNVAIGYYMPREVYEAEHTTILIHQKYAFSSIANLQKGRYENVYPFGMDSNGYEDDTQLILMAQCVNWCYNKKGDLSNIENEREEMAQSWDKLSVCKKFSNVYNAMTIPTKQRSMAGGVADESMYRVEHNRWNMEELLLQFRPATAEEASKLAADNKSKDEQRGIHTYIVPYDQLSTSIQEYDKMIVNASKDIQNIVKKWITSQNL